MTNPPYRRTMIHRLSVRRYRSVAKLDLEDLPSVIVLYGPNGSGKSNILRAAQLVLRAAGLSGDLPMKKEQAGRLSLADADKNLDLRPDDFRFGDLPEIQVALELELGSRAMQILAPPSGRDLRLLNLQAVFQLDEPEGAIRYWFDRADIDGVLEIGPPADAARRAERASIQGLRAQRAQHEAQREVSAQQSAALDAQPASPQILAQRAAHRAQIRALSQALSSLDAQIRQHEEAVGEESFVAERIQGVLIPRLLQVSPAYRVPRSPDDPESALYRALVSEDVRQQEAAWRLSQRLARAGLFGVRGEVALVPVESRTYAERQVRFRHPQHGPLSMRNLGTGEQQVVIMLGQGVITPCPIAHLEEPEAHLHKTLMESFATVLRESAAGNGDAPDVDQLWIATHHRYFALSDEFFDVAIDERGGTNVARRKRDEVAKHFYEPSPYRDTLRLLLESGMAPETIVFVDEAGTQHRAIEVLESLEADGALARKFVDSATKAFVLSLIPDEREA